MMMMFFMRLLWRITQWESEAISKTDLIQPVVLWPRSWKGFLVLPQTSPEINTSAKRLHANVSRHSLMAAGGWLRCHSWHCLRDPGVFCFWWFYRYGVSQEGETHANRSCAAKVPRTHTHTHTSLSSVYLQYHRTLIAYIIYLDHIVHRLLSSLLIPSYTSHFPLYSIGLNLV